MMLPHEVREYKTYRFGSAEVMDMWLNRHREWVPISVFSHLDVLSVLCCRIHSVYKDDRQ